MGRLYASRILAELDKALGTGPAFLLCVSAHWRVLCSVYLHCIGRESVADKQAGPQGPQTNG